MGMTREEAIKNIKEHCYFANLIPQAKEALDMAIKALEQQSCEDCISRQAVLSKIKEVCFSEEWTQFRVDNGSNGQRDFLINYIDKLPPVTPQQKVGKWNFIGDCMFECSSCKTPYTQQQLKYMCNYTYEEFPKCCPNCGAKIESEDK